MKKRPQGTNDPHSEWAKASFNIAKQLAIRYGKLDPRRDPDPPMPPREENNEDNAEPQFTSSENPAASTAASTTKSVFGPEPLPPFFDPAQLEPLHQCQVAYWDETHRVCDLKSSASKTARGLDYVYRFHRDEDGALDPNGKLVDDDPTTLKVKYEEEVRLCLGVFIFSILVGRWRDDELNHFLIGTSNCNRSRIVPESKV
mgnify:CR=1 FL=1